MEAISSSTGVVAPPNPLRSYDDFRGSEDIWDPVAAVSILPILLL